MTMICPDCGNMIAYNSYFSAFYCPRCGGFFKKAKPMTNADRIRSMSDDELDCFLHKVTYGMDECPYEYGSEKSLEWLQQPAEENDDGT